MAVGARPAHCPGALRDRSTDRRACVPQSGAHPEELDGQLGVLHVLQSKDNRPLCREAVLLARGNVPETASASAFQCVCCADRGTGGPLLKIDPRRGCQAP